MRRPFEALGLKDGRRLGYAEYGDPTGFPILAFHGIPGSRLTFAFAHEKACRRRLRLIAPDRPGIGCSDPSPQRSILDWAGDLRQLVDRLELGNFGLIGVSGGGPYALAVAHRLADRVAGTAIVSGMGPVDDPWVLERATRAQRIRLHLFRDVPGFILLLTAAAGAGLKHLPDERLMRIIGRVPEPGREVLRETEAAASVFGPLREAYRQGAGGVRRDLKLMVQPWRFRIEEVPGPVCLWHGEDDFDVPVILGRAVARRLPCCDAHFLQGAGHLWVLGHIDEVLAELGRLLKAI